MTETEAHRLGEYAKRLFPVTTDERITSLSVAILSFPDAAFVERVLLGISHETDKLDIPAIRNRLTAELHRRGVFADVVQREAEERAERRRQEREAADKSKAEVDAFLAGLDAEDLSAFKTATLAAMPADSQPFYAKLDPAKSVPLRAAMYAHMNANVMV